MKKIIILDYSTGEVHVADYDPAVYDDGDEFVARLQETGIISPGDNSYHMIVDELKITIH